MSSSGGKDHLTFVEPWLPARQLWQQHFPVRDSVSCFDHRFRRWERRRAGDLVRFCCLMALLLVTWAARCAFAQDTEREYLSGRGKDDAVPWKFLCTSGAQSGYWTNLAVPSQWDMQGFGTLNYQKDAANAADEKGLYEREFVPSATWTNRRIFLVFEGVMTDTTAKINGEPVGPTHQGGFYRFKYEVTKLIKPGETNRLEVTVAKHSADESVNKAERLADYWVFGGIYRPVYLEAGPRQFIDRVAINARADGEFVMDVFTDGATNTEELEAQVYTAAGETFGDPAKVRIDMQSRVLRSPAVTVYYPPGVSLSEIEAQVFDAATNFQNRTTIRMKFTAPQCWTAETPNLYGVEVRLKRGTEIVHRFRQRFGFRTMEVREGDGLYVNGKRVILKGADRHSFWPESGRCLSEQVHQLDIETMKAMNMNAVRMSHYPPDSEFLDLCDESGLYVLDELAGWHNHYDTEIGRKLVEEMVTRDVNHPSILFWDNGNEGGWNTNLDTEFGRWDPQQRRVLHPWSPFSGVNTAHYLAYEDARIAATGRALFHRNGRESVNTNDSTKYIYMPTEFLHGLFDGGAGAGLDDYWKMMTASKIIGGGFIWALTDDGVKRPDTGLIDTAGNQAPDGIVGPYRQREASFSTIKEIWSPIQVTRQSDSTFSVENHYNFIDANQCKFTRQSLRFPMPDEKASEPMILHEESVNAPSVPPGGKGPLGKPAPGENDSDALALKVEDPFGRELWTWVWPGSKAGDLTSMINAPASQKVTGTETPDSIEIKAGDLRVKISRETGRLSAVSRGDQNFSLANGPRLPLTNSTLTSIHSDQDGPDYIVSAKFSGDLKSISWRIYGSGWVQCEYKYTASGTNDFLGVIFDYPEDYVTGKRWLGDGPYRVWKNRLRGVTFGLWQNQYNDTITGWRGWDYPEFKGCFANVRWLQLETTEGMMTIVPQKIPFVQVLTPSQPPDNVIARTKVNLPRAGLGLLHAIPAMGTKFTDARASGPESQPNVANGEYSGSVSFYFGELPEKNP